MNCCVTEGKSVTAWGLTQEPCWHCQNIHPDKDPLDCFREEASKKIKIEQTPQQNAAA